MEAAAAAAVGGDAEPRALPTLTKILKYFLDRAKAEASKAGERGLRIALEEDRSNVTQMTRRTNGNYLGLHRDRRGPLLDNLVARSENRSGTVRPSAFAVLIDDQLEPHRELHRQIVPDLAPRRPTSRPKPAARPVWRLVSVRPPTSARGHRRDRAAGAGGTWSRGRRREVIWPERCPGGAWGCRPGQGGEYRMTLLAFRSRPREAGHRRPDLGRHCGDARCGRRHRDAWRRPRCAILRTIAFGVLVFMVFLPPAAQFCASRSLRILLSATPRMSAVSRLLCPFPLSSIAASLRSSVSSLT